MEYASVRVRPNGSVTEATRSSAPYEKTDFLPEESVTESSLPSPSYSSDAEFPYGSVWRTNEPEREKSRLEPSLKTTEDDPSGFRSKRAPKPSRGRKRLSATANRYVANPSE